MFEQDGVVSLWAGQHRVAPTIDVLRELCAVDYYNVDFQEGVVAPEWTPTPLSELVGQLSYSESYLDAVIEAADELGIETAVWVVMQLNFAYDPAKVERSVPDDAIFIGRFQWVDDDL